MAKKKKNNQSKDPKGFIAIIKAVRKPLNFFVLIVLIAEAILGTVVSFNQGIDRTILVTGMVLLLLVTLVVVTVLTIRNPEAVGLDNPSGSITALPTRESYMTAMIQKIPTAEESILLTVHTMKPSTAEGKIPLLQRKLEDAVDKKRIVKILMPSGPDKVAAAFELNQEKHIPIRVLSSLEKDDLRYMLIDDNTTILSLETSEENGSSKAGAVIYSNRLNKLLRRHFETNWEADDAMEYEPFLKSEVRKLLDASPTLPIKDIAFQLGITEEKIDKVFQISGSKVIFLLGRPCSGKTEATAIMKKYLLKKGYNDSSIQVINDYRILFDWFKKDNTHKNFEAEPLGGFRVKNFEILDKCIYKLNDSISELLNNKKIIIVEFARREYEKALQIFDQRIQDSCTIMYLYAPMNICIKRNEGRVRQGSNEERGYIPEDILTSYYSEDDIQSLSEKFTKRLITIDNTENGIDLLQDRITNAIFEKITDWLK